MLTLENGRKILNPIELKSHIKHEKVKGSWGDIKWLFNIYRNKYFKKGKNLVSLSYFLLRDVDEVYSFSRGKTLENYQKNHIEKIRTYNQGIKKILKRCKKSHFNITVRIYCDITTINILEQFLDLHNIELYCYFIPKFFEEKRLCHAGFFGTLMRYLPLFEHKYHNEGEWNTVTISDIDTQFYTEYNLMTYFIKHPRLPNILYKNRGCYYVTPRVLHQNANIPEISVISSFISQRKPKNLQILINFLNECILNESPKYKKLLNKYLPFDLSKKFLKGRLEYGVDEYFMNIYYIKYAYLEENKPISEAFVNDTSFGINNWLFILMNDPNLKLKNPKLFESFLLFNIQLFFDKSFKIPVYKDPYELLNIIGDRFYADGYYKKQYPLEVYQKVVDYIYRVGPEELNIDPRIMTCFNRGLIRHNDSTVIKVVKPNPSYPKYTETIFDVYKHN